MAQTGTNMGALLVVPTPVGNMEDMGLRAIRLLKEADLVLAEDTRVSGRLLKRHGIETRMLSHHQHNEHKLLGELLAKMQGGMQLALVSDAGTPGISDPAFLLIRACIREGIRVECLPGPTAFVPALVASGLPCERFCFEGFLPQRKGRQSRLAELSAETRTMVFYESPHRLAKTLAALAGALGADRKACVAREISKLHEEYRRGSLEALASHYAAHPTKGEITLVVAGKA